ncbi:hypothetical protein PENARI_c091G11564 [Penicillium arizonense]|uniref:FAD-binding FR-type domain-containing protein n=1 Tax=Penicillium arizonense TaxID=1835702 RepID=A0A1F5L0L8_PENAI|nr:hypothetical protein PENARI_c124G00703 [Penicillium arizonense]XP_022482213.1 hypothetical protein PENARI_c122G06215 [Penicillium arizonense]XP_022482261.1 hypothetical protein PENARI_c108G11042 [Penicillium arizonense]XP_022482376.1 hypothetical protein PENARI_c091G11564 [Penicillium arizonense]OGE46738.1 hypothetical protein PENARI_c124G00703 [Penicillium arizonense]OGE46745.1 hypothetical protein PENARI_c122G06215 [Penicillium arizonense]OGE46794.1 hypothetical protein PENARI_c108G11042
MAAWDQKPWRSSRNKVVMNSVSHFLWLDIELPLNRAIRPGQYVQLWMPRAGFRAFFQLPQFYIAFWEDGPTQRIVRMVAEPQPGLARKLYHEALRSPVKQSAIILGPYGHPLDFYRFGTILFVVEDIGFFRALSYIEMLVEASRKREVMVRKLEVLWKRQVGKDENPQWVNEWMQDLFNRDWRSFKILRFSIYCPRTQSSPQENLSYEHNAMLCYFYGSIKIEEEVARYLNNQRGAMAVAVCAGPSISEAVTKTVQPHAGRNLQLIVLDPDMSPAPDGNDDLPGSVESAVDRQDPTHTASGAGEGKRIHQERRIPVDNRKLQYSSPTKIDTETGKVEMSNHSNLVGFNTSLKFAYAHRVSDSLRLPLVEASSIEAVSTQWLSFQLIGNRIFRRQFMYHREGTMESLEPGLVRRTAGDWYDRKTIAGHGKAGSEACRSRVGWCVHFVS